MSSPVAWTVTRADWRRYVELTKPRVVALMVFTVAVGMTLATPSIVPWRVFVFGTLGIALLAASAASLNHLIDQRVDALMARTRGRPLPTGALQGAQAAVFAVVLGAIGTVLLLAFTNPLCTVLTWASLVGYAGIYSLFLKRSTPQNIVIGGAAGAAPPLLGWVAVTGHLDAGALVLFLIILIWTPPHFWALAIHRRDDYARASLPMLPVTHGVPFTCGRILAYTVALWVVSLLPFAIGMAGWTYLAGAAVLGGRFTWLAWRLRRDIRLAMPVFRYSIVYLSGIFALLLLDHALASIG
ncbi:heme o synthase [Piscinibacter gummiphilus]|uniref:Protoheme IX farnesyltransferase n=1 Tax=Piscinibacter gummiphilus TaxID=946333 RepID=A0A1W6LA75_9BURK|nr:heme o synthase [Piscinibacter gummiphilus]ARN21087.1 protoheme IX farnesyltransferase [Piscinibacter gummiphilus]ATU65765.1 protoheme IX farnesyltransferase [Piscinibacter gummiphilus]GLS93635.1 protoheme IX farnesyltransferase 1 [Piscinibacter gummiphilus]